LKDFRVDTSQDGKRFTVAVSGRFAIANQGHLNRLVPTAKARSKVRFVRLRVLTNQGNFDPLSGSAFADVSELAVHGIQVGKARAIISGPRRIKLGRTVTFRSKSSTGLARSPIVRRAWSRAGAKTKRTTSYRLHATRLGKIRLKLTVVDFAGHRGTVTKVVT